MKQLSVLLLCKWRHFFFLSGLFSHRYFSKIPLFFYYRLLTLDSCHNWIIRRIIHDWNSGLQSSTFNCHHFPDSNIQGYWQQCLENGYASVLRHSDEVHRLLQITAEDCPTEGKNICTVEAFWTPWHSPNVFHQLDSSEQLTLTRFTCTNGS